MNTGLDEVRPISSWVVATAVTGTVGIALGAFWLSFTALSNLTVLAGVPRQEAWIWPLIVDGIIVVATISVVALSPHGRRATLYPWTLLAAGALVSVAANTAHALVTADATVPKALAACVSAVPPIVLLAITHLTVELTRRTRVPAVDAAPAPVQPEPEKRTVARLDIEVEERRDKAARLREAGLSNRMIARELGVHPSTVGRWLPAAIESVGGDSPSAVADEQGALSTH
jgi:transposase-like protein